MVSRRKPHNHHAGYIAMRRHPILKGPDAHVTIYEAEAQQLCTAGGRYAIVCDSHGTIMNDTSLKGARASMKNPGNFCDGCRAIGCPG